MIIAGAVKSSLADFPGSISCVLFTPGCNFDCFYCHNRQLIDGTHREIDTVTVLDFLRKRVGQLDGVVLTGGEPTLQPDLLSFVQTIKAMGYKVKLDTNGSSPGVIANILKERLCDYYAVDYKAPAARCQEICRGAAAADDVRQTIRLLLEHEANFEVRTTVIPQLGQEDLIQMASEIPVVPAYVLNRYRRPEKYRDNDHNLIKTEPYTQEQISAFTDILRCWQPNIRF
jgi:pyruvate formate lyase activating enzyme